MIRAAAAKHLSKVLIPSTEIIIPHLSIQTRFYRGGSDEGSSGNLTNEELLLQEKAQQKYDSIYERHIRLPKIESEETKPEGYENLSQEEAELEMRKKRLIYRSKQRGWLEVDLLLGTWAYENVGSLTKDELDEFENFVNMETIDIYNIVTLRAGVPEEMKIAQKIQDWVKCSPLGKADPEAYKNVKIERNLT